MKGRRKTSGAAAALRRNHERKLSWDWFPGVIPENVKVDKTAYLETTFSFQFFHSRRADGLEVGRGASTYLGTMFDVGPKGRVKLGQYALVHGARIICDAEIIIGDYALISWNVVLMDTYRVPFDAEARRKELERMVEQANGLTAHAIEGREIRLRHSDRGQVRRTITAQRPRGSAALAWTARPIYIDRNVWIGFESCVLPGVTIGEGSIVGARSVVTESVPPFTIVAGNPARVIRRLDPERGVHAASA